MRYANLDDKILEYDNEQTDQINKNATDIESNTITINELKPKVNQNEISISSLNNDVQQLSNYQEYMLVPEQGFTVDETLIQKKGNIVFVSGVVRGEFPSSAYTKAATLPNASLRPKVTLYGGAATVGGRPAIVALYNSGGLEFNHVTEANRAWMGFNLSYIVD